MDYTLYKGWTRVYETYEFTVSDSINFLRISTSNKEPKDYEMKWYFAEDFYNSLPPDFAPISIAQKAAIKKLLKKVR
jgi:hypothetical protein